MTKPTVEELLQMVDQAIAYNAKDAEDFESNVHLQAEMSCVAENAGILATALRERLVGEQHVEIVGYVVWTKDVKSGAFYNYEEKFKAFDAFARWADCSISALAIHPTAPEPSDGKE
jgi:hypothetical protein